MGLDENAYAVYTVLKEFEEDITPERVQALNRVFEQFSDYQWDVQHSQLRNVLITLRPIVGAENMILRITKLRFTIVGTERRYESKRQTHC